MSKQKDEIVTSLKAELKITIKEDIQDAMREFENDQEQSQECLPIILLQYRHFLLF